VGVWLPLVLAEQEADFFLRLPPADFLREEDAGEDDDDEADALEEADGGKTI
jgi:hypothetical protein